MYIERLFCYFNWANAFIVTRMDISYIRIDSSSKKRKKKRRGTIHPSPKGDLIDINNITLPLKHKDLSKDMY